MKILYDTCSLLDLQDEIFHISDSKFYICSISINELENIKSSGKKDEETKYKARNLLRQLAMNEDKFEIVIYKSEYSERLAGYDLPDTNDTKIIASAYCFFEDNGINGIFHTKDLACKAIAKSIGLNVVSDNISQEKSYLGFREVEMDDIDLCDFYSNILPNKKDPFGLNLNEYLIIKNDKGQILDKYKLTLDGYVQVQYHKFDSNWFGKVGPYEGDIYQLLAMDSIETTDVTLLAGPPGSGKTYLALSYLFQELEKHNIDRIVIFCNPVVAKGAAKLGFLPGTKEEKLLASQVGNVLSSKLGDMCAVEELIAKGKLILIPAGDARGYQVPSYSGVYILESQNLSVELLKLILQRIPEDTKVIVDGDYDNQVDLDTYSGSNNGMRKMIEVFKGEPIYSQVVLQNIYRSQLANIAEKMK